MTLCIVKREGYFSAVCLESDWMYCEDKNIRKAFTGQHICQSTSIEVLMRSCNRLFISPKFIFKED